jgi:hypothetical protein
MFLNTFMAIAMDISNYEITDVKTNIFYVFSFKKVSRKFDQKIPQVPDGGI